MHRSSRFTLTTIFSLLLLFAVGFALLDHGSISTHAAGTSASITLALTYGPPTSAVGVSGKGFKGSETVTLTFDTTPLKSVKASKTGSISTTIAVPASAQPGNHFVQGRGSSSGFFAQATFLVQTDWVQQGFNREHTGFNVFENVLNTTSVSQLTQNGAYSSTYAGPAAVANGVIYVGCTNASYELCAFDVATGRQLWSSATGNYIASAPAVASGLVYVGSYDNKLYAFNAATGLLVWSYATGSAIVGSPLVANGVVYVGSDDNTLYALNAASGKVVWSYTTKGSITDTPGLDNGVIYIGAYDGNVYALNALTGVLKWHFTTRGSIGKTPVIANGVVYIGSNDGNLYALNEITGVLKWSSNTASNSSASVANGLVYFTGNCGLYALNATTGTIAWSYNPQASYGSCIESTPTIANGVVYIGGATYDPSDGVLFAFSATTGAWLREVDLYSTSDISYQPVVVNGIVYCSTNDGLYTLR